MAMLIFTKQLLTSLNLNQDQVLILKLTRQFLKKINQKGRKGIRSSLGFSFPLNPSSIT